MHGIYKQKNLPYLAVKVCPKCQSLVKIEENNCSVCNFDFINNQEQIVEKKEKTSYVFDQAIASSNIHYTPKQEEYVSPKKSKSKYLFDQAIASDRSYKSTSFEEKIDDFETAALSVKDLDLQDLIICDKCGAKVFGKQRYCGGCGAKITKRKCPSCKSMIDNNLAFCPMCGEKVQEYSNIEKSKEDVNKTLSDFEDTSPFNLENLNNKRSFETNDNEIVIENDNGINIYRKRTFLIIQMIFSILVLVSLLFSPLLSNTFEGMFNVDATSLINGNKFISFIFTSLFSNTFDLSSISNLLISNEQYIFSSLPLLKDLIGENALLVSFIIISIVYAINIISIVILLMTSIIGLKRNTPLKGITLCILVICLAISCILIYPIIFTEAFLNYETWLLYAFAFAFVLWFILKLVFFKENAIYKRTHKK